LEISSAETPAAQLFEAESVPPKAGVPVEVTICSASTTPRSFAVESVLLSWSIVVKPPVGSENVSPLRKAIAPIQSWFALDVVEVAPLAGDVELPIATACRSTSPETPLYSAPTAAMAVEDWMVMVTVELAPEKTLQTIVVSQVAFAATTVFDITDSEPLGATIGAFEFVATAMTRMFPAVGADENVRLIDVMVTPPEFALADCTRTGAAIAKTGSSRRATKNDLISSGAPGREAS
jgi:hypothetical protein